jgi:hypothetical protein
MTQDHEFHFYKIIVLVAGFVVVFLSLFVFPVTAFDRFVKNSDGTITDTKTNLMWAARDNGVPVNWMDAKSYCRKFDGGGYSDWRIPNLAELSSLYDPKENNKHGYHISHLIETTAASCWASETKDDKAARFNFTYGTVYWLRKPYSGPTRVLPVRKLK